MKITHNVDIDASIDDVWNTTIDIGSWPEWNSNVNKVIKGDDKFEIGSSAVIMQRGLPPTSWVVSKIEDKKEFTWEGKVYGINMSATHTLEAKGKLVSNRLTINAEGFLVYLLWPILRKSFHESLEKENSDLKRFLENEFFEGQS